MGNEGAKFRERISYGLKTVGEPVKPKGKVLVVITNRSSYGKVKTVVEGMVALGIDTTLVLAGSLWLYKYGKAGENICEDFPKLQKYIMDTIVEGESDAKMADSVAVLIQKVTTIIGKESPDLVITVADRFETIGTAIAASYMNVDVVHIQGGEVTGSIDDKVRNAVTALSDWHFPSTEDAAKRVASIIGYGDINGSESAYHGIDLSDIKEVENFGCPSMDLLERYAPGDESTQKKAMIREVNHHGTGDQLKGEPYIIVMYHPDTTCIKKTMEDMGMLIASLERVDIQKVVFWPNIDSYSDRISKMWRGCGLDRIRFVRHLSQEWFALLLYFSSGIIGNSSAGVREASYYGIPSIDIGSRQCGREGGPNCVHLDGERGDLEKAIKDMVSKERVPSTLYGDGNAGNKIAKRISEILEEK